VIQAPEIRLRAGGAPVDELEPDLARIGTAGIRRDVPDEREPTEAAELHIAVFPANRSGCQADISGSAVSSGRPPVQPGIPGVRFGMKVPSAQAGQLLRVTERVMPLAIWQISVIGSLFGAAAAHLPPAGTTTVVILEILVPPLMLRRRKREKST
jgi:hypothetical protein